MAGGKDFLRCANRSIVSFGSANDGCTLTSPLDSRTAEREEEETKKKGEFCRDCLVYGGSSNGKGFWILPNRI
ncbi:hypothetical protein CEXT_105331 [Caerostris extrusa]|uniref:Uncharacterized protein n=1 Tax=Caerostris extrusa TaxID=172846 RepID=A0AAV4NPJ1_CAEEX|nr:hypothetical protein CEXT_105331 [Caerostris extrusa]